MPLITKHYNSVELFSKAVTNFANEDKHKVSVGGYGNGYNSYGGSASALRGIEVLKTGEIEGVSLVREYMKTVMQNIPTLARVWKSDVAGFFPNIPAFLAGEPESMWRFDNDYSDTVPVRIWINCLPSSGNSKEEIYLRGAAVTALAMVLAERRTMVRISPYADLGIDRGRNGSVVSYDLPNPLVLSQVVAALANENASRNAFHFVNSHINPNGHGGWVLGHCPGYRYSDAQCKADLNAGPDDIVVPAAYFGDAIIADPIAWINKALKPYLDQEV